MKVLQYSKWERDILDRMGSVELGANIFRITQTEALLEKQETKSEKNGNRYTFYCR